MGRLKGVELLLRDLDVVRDLCRIAGTADSLQGFRGRLQGVFRAGLPAVGAVVLFGGNEGPVVPDYQVDVLSVLALALQRRFDLFRQVFAQKISDSFNDHRCSFLRCLYGGFHALRGPAWSPDGCGLYYEKGAARRRRLFHLEKGIRKRRPVGRRLLLLQL